MRIRKWSDKHQGQQTLITQANFPNALLSLGFEEKAGGYFEVEVDGARMGADFEKQVLIYPEDQGLVVNERQTCNFSMAENFVVFECVLRLLRKGYLPKDLELEPRWQVGHGASGGRADVLVKRNDGTPILLIECKTAGAEFDREWRTTLNGHGQLFTYAQQISAVQFLALYCSDFVAGTVKYQNHIIAHRDNEKYLADNPSLASFRSATSAVDRFTVWRETYQTDYTTKGIFEPTIQPYIIGKDKYTVEDLTTIDEADRKKKYNEFATILRQHNVSGRENAFDKLVNLFLCKLVDEATNRDDLKFYWKGVAYDTQIDLLDRLQLLYQAGMARFLGEDITYINEDDVSNALRYIRKTPDATHKAVWDLFVQQKFYTNNDFSFIDVHNEQLFYQNAEVLVRILTMWQDVRLTTDGAVFNQFLGDMFEGFLDQGVKQSEGQFFTPMPLTRFIIQSLPLKSIVAAAEPPMVLDYACGAGHFLTEYAVQVAEMLRMQTADEQELERHQERIFGIEKEYRLSKVAKVSTFMYGQPGIRIVYGDALAQAHPSYPEIKPESFDVLVANPPYSVKGFLETLPFEDRAKYELTTTIEAKAQDTNNRIETFFVERAKQLLKPGGIAAIILPSSILSNNDRPTRMARNILLDHFDILSLVELGNGAFGSTGTTTITAFLRKKSTQPEVRVHYRGRVDEWFEGDFGDNGNQQVYADLGLLQEYAAYIGVEFDDYQTLLKSQLRARLLKTPIFAEYVEAWATEPATVKWRAGKPYSKLALEARVKQESDRQVEYIRLNEREKVHAFCLARAQVEPVLVVRSPGETKEMRRFLGYNWSKAKGSEGIKLVRDQSGHHLTPMYDESDRANPLRINTYIAQNFGGELEALPPELDEYATAVPLEDLLEFREVNFDRSISLAPRGNATQIQSRFPLVKLGVLAPGIQRGASPRPIDDYITEALDGTAWVKIGDAPRGAKVITHTAERITPAGAEKSRKVKKGDFILSNSMSAGRPYIMGIDGCVHDGWLILSGLDSALSKDYLYYVLRDSFVQDQLAVRSKGPVVKNLNIDRVKSVLVPVADSETQKALVQEALAIEAELEKAQVALEAVRAKMLQMVTETATAGYSKLEAIASHIVDSVNPLAADAPARYLGLESIESGTGALTDAGDTGMDDAQSLKRRFAAGDVLYGKLRPKLNKVYLAEAPGMCSTDFLVLRFASIEAATFYSTYLRSNEFNHKVLATVTNTMPRTSWEKIKSLTVPSLSEPQLRASFERLLSYRRQMLKWDAEISKNAASARNLVKRHLQETSVVAFQEVAVDDS